MRRRLRWTAVVLKSRPPIHKLHGYTPHNNITESRHNGFMSSPNQNECLYTAVLFLECLEYLEPIYGNIIHIFTHDPDQLWIMLTTFKYLEDAHLETPFLWALLYSSILTPKSFWYPLVTLYFSSFWRLVGHGARYDDEHSGEDDPGPATFVACCKDQETGNLVGNDISGCGVFFYVGQVFDLFVVFCTFWLSLSQKMADYMVSW